MEGQGGRRKKAIWLYPKVLGFNPAERWGHSACFFDGFMYVFGGCCGGLHFSDILTLNLESMVWSSLVTTGQKPGTRDSHTAAVVGQKMIVFGGSNGSRKVNDLHVLDLRTREWTKPNCKGAPPAPRESHTATVVGEGKVVIFGGSGEGDANYLNDVHVLDVKSMTWSCPEVKGEMPAPRDSHAAVAIGNKMFIYGGDCVDRYHGEVDVLDLDTMTWSRLAAQGSSPGVRAGHAAVSVGSKLYVIGGVGDKQYYSDVWVLDVSCCTWCQLDICGPPPQGRFAHTAVVTNTDISIYGGCGEDERPLNEILILQLGSDHPNGRYNVAMCKVFSSHWSQEKRKFLRSKSAQQNAMMKETEFIERTNAVESEARSPTLQGLDNAKRRRMGDMKVCEVENEQEEHSLTISQRSSPSQSDQEPNNLCKLSTSPNGSTLSGAHMFIPMKRHQDKGIANGPKNAEQKSPPFLNSECPKLCMKRQEQFLQVDHKPLLRPCGSHLIGAEVHGTVDGAFDSGYLMTAIVNGQIFRGVLFAPGPGITAPRPTVHPQVLTTSALSPHHCPAVPVHIRPPLHSTNATSVVPNWGHQFTRQPHASQVLRAKSERINSDLKDVVLTLGGPGCGN
ncbi:hypothetical protein LUZ61_020240 [Rhynchospora tenuis]|uniref:Uncharacterized protein n=1 Tax=Rhynchospora tenuis TaxID=198213 RepID=A0AAD5ZCL2_9POAL|nr:hypothetical protein LUZ61_020240 [Rhynchospora tenuis]